MIDSLWYKRKITILREIKDMTSVVAHNVKLRRVFLLVVEFILRFDTPFGKKIGPNLALSRETGGGGKGTGLPCGRGAGIHL